MIDILGGRCQDCGQDFGLEIHHIFGRDWQPSKVNQWIRLARYKREAACGLIELLCVECNRVKGKPNAADPF